MKMAKLTTLDEPIRGTQHVAVRRDIEISEVAEGWTAERLSGGIDDGSLTVAIDDDDITIKSGDETVAVGTVSTDADDDQVSLFSDDGDVFDDEGDEADDT